MAVKASSSVASVDPIYSSHNLTASTLRYYRVARAKMRNGTADLRLATIGDSIANGAGASSNLTAYFPRACALLATALGVTSRMGLVSPENAQWSVGSGWSSVGTFYGSSHNYYFSSSGNANPCTFTPTDDAGVPIQGDQFILYLYVPNTSGNPQYAIDGGSYSAVPASTDTQTPGVRRYVIPAMTRGTHTLSIKSNASSGNTLLCGAELIDSQTRGIRYLTGGNSGENTPSYDAKASVFGTTLSAFQHDLVVPQWNTNDYGNQVSLATFLANQTAVGTSLKSFTRPADVLWISSPPQSGLLTIPQQSYYDTMDAAADASGTAVLHIDKTFGSYTIGNGLSLYSDGVHPTTAGHGVMASLLAAILAI